MTDPFHPAVSLTLFLAIMTPFAMAVVGAVSVLIHPRDSPTTAGEWVLCACRVVAYAMAALLAAMFGLYALVGIEPASAFVAVIIAFALIGLRMRHDHHNTGGDPNGP
jgi:hypothetical protein